MTKAPRLIATVRLALAAGLGGLTLLALMAVPAAAAPSASLDPTSGCDLKVINDWADNGQVDGVYAIPCYTQAIQRLNTFPDLKGYSSAADDIQLALLARLHQDRGTGGPTTGGGGGGSPVGPNTKPPTGGGSHRSFWQDVTNRVGPGNAQSIPLPLIVLGGLAVLLLLTAAATWFARRVQTRRMTPAPATSPAGQKRR